MTPDTVVFLLGFASGIGYSILCYGAYQAGKRAEKWKHKGGETVAEAVKCPKCGGGQMVPLSKAFSEYTVAGQFPPVLNYAEWRCVKCGHCIKAT